MTEQKFCFGCQKYRNASDVKVVKRGNRNRMVCVVCLAKRNVSPYTTKKA